MEKRQFLVITAILICEMCQGIAYLGLFAGLVLLLQTSLDYTSDVAISFYFVYKGILHFVPLFGGWLGDSVIGRFNANYAGYLLYFLGALLLPIVTSDFQEMLGQTCRMSLNSRRGFCVIAMIAVSIGNGLLKANACTFGIDQAGGKDAAQWFLHAYTVVGAVGSMVSLTGLVYMQQNVSLFGGYSVIAGIAFLTLVTFVAPRRHYTRDELSRFGLKEVFFVTLQSLKRWKRSSVFNSGFFDASRARHGGDYFEKMVDMVVKIFRMIPVYFCTITYWTVFYQSQSTYLIQGERMKLRIGSLTLPVASLNLFYFVTALIVTPLMNRAIFPCILRIRGSLPSTLTLFGVGIWFSVLSISTAGILEIFRKKDIAINGPIAQTLDGKTYNASSLTVFCQVPQFALLGVGGVFTMINGLDFSYTEAPEGLRSFMIGVYMCAIGAGSFLGSILVSVINAVTAKDPWLPDEMNKGHFEYFCFLLAGLLVMNMLLYVPIARAFQRNSLERISRVERSEQDSLINGEKCLEYGVV